MMKKGILGRGEPLMSEVKTKCGKCGRSATVFICDICGASEEQYSQITRSYGLDWCGECEEKYQITKKWDKKRESVVKEFIKEVNPDD